MKAKLGDKQAVLRVKLGKNVIQKQDGADGIFQLVKIYLGKTKGENGQPLLATATPKGQIFVVRKKIGTIEGKVVMMTTRAGEAPKKIDGKISLKALLGEIRRAVVNGNPFDLLVGVGGKKPVKVTNKGRPILMDNEVIFDQGLIPIIGFGGRSFFFTDKV